MNNNKEHHELIQKVQFLYTIFSNIKHIMHHCNVNSININRMSSSYNENNYTYYEPFLLLENIEPDPEEKDQYWSFVGFPLEQSIQMIFEYYQKILPDKIQYIKNASISQFFFGEEGVSLSETYDGYKVDQTLTITNTSNFKEFFDEMASDSIKGEIKFIQLNKKLRTDLHHNLNHHNSANKHKI
jgi:hypothetical protein